MLMTVFWISCSVIFYLTLLFSRSHIQQVDNPLDWYLYSALAEISGTLIGGIMSYKLGARNSLSAAFGLVAFGSLLLLIIEQQFSKDFNNITVKAYLSLFFELAISAAFVTLYCTNFVFPTQMASQTIGIPNIISRYITAASPLLIFRNRNSEASSEENEEAYHKSYRNAALVSLIMAAVSAFLTIFLDIFYDKKRMQRSTSFTFKLG